MYKINQVINAAAWMNLKNIMLQKNEQVIKEYIMSDPVYERYLSSQIHRK